MHSMTLELLRYLVTAWGIFRVRTQIGQEDKQKIKEK